jgi:hypothetical protein
LTAVPVPLPPPNPDTSLFGSSLKPPTSIAAITEEITFVADSVMSPVVIHVEKT